MYDSIARNNIIDDEASDTWREFRRIYDIDFQAFNA
jgi:hypothetical protein